LDKIEDLYTELDEILANFSGILGNRYLKRQRVQAEELQKTIFNATLILDDWLLVQKNWIYLENIFSSNDIKSKLREENTKFENIDKAFKAHMRLVNRSKFVCRNLGTQEQWIKAKDTLS
jgi:dynein heavy chain